jgi:hypothetical protein
MKKKLLLLVSFVSTFFANAQNVGIGTTTPVSSAALDVTSTTKGFLPPRMTTVERDVIFRPAAGLTIYNTTSNGFECYNGTAWYGTVHYIGESYGGGIIFYIYDGGQHGLIAATDDQNMSIDWYAGSFNVTHARADGIGAGLKNTAMIISNPGGPTIDPNAFAATVCNEYSVTVAGVTYGDWYLPSKYELNLLFLQKTLVGGFASYFYWSSNEFDNYYAWDQDFNNGTQGILLKGYNGVYSMLHVRAVRAF